MKSQKMTEELNLMREKVVYLSGEAHLAGKWNTCGCLESMAQQMDIALGYLSDIEEDSE